MYPAKAFFFWFFFFFAPPIVLLHLVRIRKKIARVNFVKPLTNFLIASIDRPKPKYGVLLFCWKSLNWIKRWLNRKNVLTPNTRFVQDKVKSPDQSVERLCHVLVVARKCDCSKRLFLCVCIMLQCV